MPLHGMRRHRKRLKPVAEINLTSLLDVAFVLLIAFMIVAPSLKYGVELKLPSVREGAPQLPSGELNIATIAISKIAANSPTRTFLLDGESLDTTGLEARLKEKRLRVGQQLTVEIQADRDAPYEAFVQAVAAVRRAGIEAVGLPVDVNDGAPPNRTGSPSPKPLNPQPPTGIQNIPAGALTLPPPAAGR